jgi:hypothetical protein
LALDGRVPAWLRTRVRPKGKTIQISTVLLATALLGAIWAWEARAVANSTADEARRVLVDVLADGSAKELVSRAAAQCNAALTHAAEPGQSPARGARLEAVALSWAQVARDLKRARDAEVASDRLEQELSSVQTEIVRSRAAVEQAMARVGRARQELRELESARSGAAAGSGDATRAPREAR